MRNLHEKLAQVNAKKSGYEKRIVKLDKRYKERFGADSFIEQENAMLKEQINHMKDVEERSKAKLKKYKDKLEEMTQAR